MSAFLVTAFSFLIILVAMLGMALGVLAGRKPLRGSCGGLNGESGCELCGDREQCPRRQRNRRAEVP